MKIRDMQSGGLVLMLTMLTMVVTLAMLVILVRDELHGWPALDELLTGVVGWCSVKSAATPVWCAACSMWGCSWATFGKCGGTLGLPTSSFDIHQRGSTTRRLRHPRELSSRPRQHNPKSTDRCVGSKARMMLCVSIGPPSHEHGSLSYISLPPVSSRGLRTNMRMPEKITAGHFHAARQVKVDSTSPQAPLEAGRVCQAGQSDDSTTAGLTICLYSTRDPRQPGRNAEPR